MNQRFDEAPGELPGASSHETSPDLGGMLQDLLGGAREQLSSRTVEGVAGGGAVRVTMDGEQNVLAVKLTREAVNPDDIEMLEELLVSALADAARQAQRVKMESVGALAERLGLGSFAPPGADEEG